jgi:tRNA (guanine-N7-)-methyltransferase
MKPEDLKFPFMRCKRQMMIQDHIWYAIPPKEQEVNFLFPGWHDHQVFIKEQPVCIEYCSGNGVWIAAKAQANPHQNWVAIELKFSRVRKIWSKIKNFQLSNLFVIYGEGYEVTHRYLADDSVQAIYINFPDPWPKRQHAKYRLVQPSFIKELERVLMPRGLLTFVTDDEAYSRWTLNLLLSASRFQSIHPDPYYLTDDPHYGTSYFEDLWRQKGKIIRYHTFCKLRLDSVARAS